MLAGSGKRSASLLGQACAALVATFMAFAPSAHAKVVKTDKNPQLSATVPVTQWVDDSVRPRAMVMAIHGLVLHGGVYDAMAQNLAKQGILVIAPDMRGYGRWISDRNEKSEKVRTPIDYKRSHEDIIALAQALKSEHPGIPLYGVGESLGADMLLHVAVNAHSDLDGLVLSAPAVKHRLYISDLVKSAPSVVTMPFKQIDVSRQIQKYFSNETRVTEATVEDPLVRKRMSTIELLRSKNEVDKCLHYAKRVSSNLPVLVIQGSDDQMVKGEAVADLLAALPSRDQTLEWLGNRGHLLLETPFIQQETMNIVSGWLDNHVAASQNEGGATVVAGAMITDTVSPIEETQLVAASDYIDRTNSLAGYSNSGSDMRSQQLITSLAPSQITDIDDQ